MSQLTGFLLNFILMLFFYHIIIANNEKYSENFILKLVKISYFVGIAYAELPLMSNKIIATNRFSSYVNMNSAMGIVHLSLIIFMLLFTIVYQLFIIR